MIVIINYGLGNLRSILTKFQRLGIESKISSDTTDIEKADKLIVPGIGHFGAGMNNLNKSGLIPIIRKRVLGDQVPTLGICLGFQLFGKCSDEAPEPGLAFIPAASKRFEEPAGNLFRVPHIGWNEVHIRAQSPLLNGIPGGTRFYFTHSYYVSVEDPGIVTAETDHGINFVSIVQKENIFGAQFHPEKSHAQGLQLLENFAKL